MLTTVLLPATPGPDRARALARCHHAHVAEQGGIEGRATPEGTARFAARFDDLPGHFRAPDRLWLASIGLGTLPGDPGGADDLLYRGAVPAALEHGSNVFDTSPAYRMQRSERTLGAALARALHEGRAARDEVFVISKGGYLVADPDLVLPSGGIWGRSEVSRSLKRC